MTILRDLLCGPGNKHWDLVRCGTAIGMASMCGALFYSLYQGIATDFIGFGTGMAALIGALGLGAKLKDKPESTQ